MPWTGIEFLGGMLAGVTFYFTQSLAIAGFVALRSGESVATVFIGTLVTPLPQISLWWRWHG